MPHFAGHMILIVAGHALVQTAGIFLIASTAAKLLWGHKDLGMQISSVLSMIGVAMLFGPSAYQHDVWAMAAYVITMAGLCYAFFGHWLDEKFSDAPTGFIRFMLGEPRQRVRDAFLIGKIPTTIYALTTQNWALLAAQAVYAIGDLLLGASKVEAKQ